MQHLSYVLRHRVCRTSGWQSLGASVCKSPEAGDFTLTAQNGSCPELAAVSHRMVRGFRICFLHVLLSQVVTGLSVLKNLSVLKAVNMYHLEKCQ